MRGNLTFPAESRDVEDVYPLRTTSLVSSRADPFGSGSSQSPSLSPVPGARPFSPRVSVTPGVFRGNGVESSGQNFHPLVLIFVVF